MVVPIFVFWNFAFKVCNNDWSMVSFFGGGGLPLFLSGFKMKYSIRLEDDFIDFSDYLDMP